MHVEVGAGTCKNHVLPPPPKKKSDMPNIGEEEGEKDLKQNFPFWVEFLFK